MEQKYVNQLRALEYPGDPDKVGTVLKMRAYHNGYCSVTDCSYSVINMPRYYDNETEKKLLNKVSDVLIRCYNSTEKRTHFAPAGLPPYSILDNGIQFEFSDELTEEELTAKTVKLLNTALDAYEELRQRLDPNSEKYELSNFIINIVSRRIKTILVFIEAGSTSYELNHVFYDPLD